MSIRAVLFDMDGVLIDAKEWHFEALNEALSIFGFEISLNEHNSTFDGLSTRRKLEILSEEKGLPRNLHKVIESIKQNRTLRIAAQKCYPNVMHLILLERLKAMGLKVGMVTNSVYLTANFMTTYAGLAPYFDVVITNEDVSKQKPDPEGYLKAMKILSIAPHETLIIEDGDYGIKAALGSGAKVKRVTGVNDVNLEYLLPVIRGLDADFV
jgi:beta-phosphoglucomutase